MRPVLPIRRLPCRLLQIAPDEITLHGIKDRAMKEEGIPLAPLGIARDFFPIDRQITSPEKNSTRLPPVKRSGDPFEDEFIGAADIGELSMQRQRQDERIGQATGSLEDGPAAARASKHRDSICFARINIDIVHEPAGRAQDHEVAVALPKTQDRITADIVQFVKQGLVQGEVLYR